MSDLSSASLVVDNFLDFISNFAWCKQDGDVLVAVHKFCPEAIVVLSGREAKLYPGATPVKINKSWLATLQEKNAEGTPVPLLIVWKEDSLEIWYRRHKSFDFPYDTWQNPAGAAYERECVKIPASAGGSKFNTMRVNALTKAKACPSMIPQM